MTERGRFAGALALLLIGGAGALLLAGRSWQRIVAPRPRPFTDEVVSASGRTLEPAVAALAVVALAGVVAALATRGIARRIVGGVLALVGVAMVWRALVGLSAVAPSRASSLVADAHTGAGLDPGMVPRVGVHVAWPLLAALCGLAVAVGGVLLAAWGHRFARLSGRYEAPQTRTEVERQRSDAMFWNALDRGHDPTADGAPDT